MKTKQIVTRAAGVIVVVGALCGAGTVAQANEQSGDQASKAQSRTIEGVWETVVTAQDCQTQAPLFGFLGMVSYTRGGSLYSRVPLNPPSVRPVWASGGTSVGGISRAPFNSSLSLRTARHPDASDSQPASE
jgi:hypothetical protein